MSRLCVTPARTGQYAERIIATANVLHKRSSGAQELKKLRQKIKDFASQLEALAEHLSKIPKGVSPAVVFAQMKLIEDLRAKTEGEVSELERKGIEYDPPAALTSYEAFIGGIKQILTQSQDNDKKAQLLALLIH